LKTNYNIIINYKMDNLYDEQTRAYYESLQIDMDKEYEKQKQLNEKKKRDIIQEEERKILYKKQLEQEEEIKDIKPTKEKLRELRLKYYLEKV
jgi:hypothetical protein